MNKARRELLSKVELLLDQAAGFILRALDEEQNCLDNMPENLQDSEKYQKMETAVDNLESAVDSIAEAKESIASASE